MVANFIVTKAFLIIAESYFVFKTYIVKLVLITDKLILQIKIIYKLTLLKGISEVQKDRLLWLLCL